jgi:hypothetical protein
MAKLAESGDLRKWMLWLKELVEEPNANAAAGSNRIGLVPQNPTTALARSQALPDAGTKKNGRAGRYIHWLAFASAEGVR